MSDYKNVLNKPNFGEYKVLKLFKKNGYRITLGIPEEQIEKLIKYSTDLNDKSLINNTGDLNRFSSYDKINRWYNDEKRYLFCLLDDKDNLAGIWWGRPAIFPNVNKIIDKKIFKIIQDNLDNIHTSGIRIYPNHRGKGLAKNILEAESIYRQIYNNVYMSIDINSNNIPSQKAYERMGYVYFANGKNVNKGDSNDDNRMIYIKI